jgi:hypothetical protein
MVSRHSYYVIGKYNNKGQYMIHRIYICTNLNSPFVIQNYHQLEDCNNNNIVMPCSSSFVLNKTIESEEGEHMFLASVNLLQADVDKIVCISIMKPTCLLIFLCEPKRQNWKSGYIPP